jgi:hypothetical protein
MFKGVNRGGCTKIPTRPLILIVHNDVSQTNAYLKLHYNRNNGLIWSAKTHQQNQYFSSASHVADRRNAKTADKSPEKSSPN